MINLQAKIEVPDHIDVHWSPHSGPQTFALKQTANEILYGGARGGGKTDASVAWITRWFDNSDLRFLVIRKNSGDLDDWIDRAKRIWAPYNPEFTLREVRLPSGAKGRFGHLHDSDAYERYQGHEYQKMIIEELTHIPTEELYLKLLGSNRSTVDGLKPQVFCTTNPGNAGHKWVYERFVEDRDPGRLYTYNHRTRIFIPARVRDNPTIVEKDPGYIRYLESLPKPLRKAWLEGSWDTPEVKGSIYSKWLNEARDDGRIGMFPYEKHKRVDTFWDIGRSDATSIWFVQLLGKEIRFIDHYEASGEDIEFYAKILDDKGYRYGTHHLPHDAESKTVGMKKSTRTIAENSGLKPIKIVKRHDVWDGIQAGRMLFNKCTFNQKTCEEGLRALRNYRKEWDDKRNEFKRKPYHDWASHAADAFRYMSMVYEKRLPKPWHNKRGKKASFQKNFE